MTDANIALVERIYRAFAEGDQATLAQTFADDVDMVQVGNNALAGAFHGRAALFQHFADIPRHTEELTMEPIDLLAGANGNVCALNRMTVRKDGETRAFDVIHLFTIAGGKVTALRSIPQDPYALDAFVG